MEDGFRPGKPAAEEEPDVDNLSNAEEQNEAAGDLGRRVTALLHRMVEHGKLVAKPRGRLTPEKEAAYREEIAARALALAQAVHYPGERYLVRWGGTRKGSGVFYTRPGLSVPLIQRTLAPLAYSAPLNPDGSENRDASLSDWTPKKPEEILTLKVCDIACGSGTFPVGALRFLTKALWESVHFHQRVSTTGDNRTAVSLFGKTDAGESIADEYLPCLPDDETYEVRLRARLKRHVAERCIYGVDLDPLAVELCRLALWVETLDHELPFTFLNHKIKCGNSLVGCWYDRYQHYPVMAFAREAGDKSHASSVHHPVGRDTTGIDQFWKRQVIPELGDMIQGQGQLFGAIPRTRPAELHNRIRSKLDSLHALPVHASKERSDLYRDIRLDADFKSIQDDFDLWCAIWFWPISDIPSAPLPSTFGRLPDPVLETVRLLAQTHKFFHWELEFPDVFCGIDEGFHAVVGNPPWDIAKPNSKEYFSNFDPLFRLYGKQDAIEAQRNQFRSDSSKEEKWLEYCSNFKSFSNWVRWSGKPFGELADPDGERSFSFGRGRDRLHDLWANSRAALPEFAVSDPNHPFIQQGGGDTNLYKCFMEQAHALLRRGGRFGQIVPSGIHTDKGTQPLRILLREECSWEWCFCFENRRKLFPIDSRFKFDLIVAQKGATTDSVRCSFMRHELADWSPGLAESMASYYRASQILNYSPLNESLMETRDPQDNTWLDKAYSTRNCLLGIENANGWNPKYVREFDLTLNSAFFSRRTKLETQGYRPDCYGRWIEGDWQTAVGVDGAIRSFDGSLEIIPEQVSLVTTRIKVKPANGGRAIPRDIEHPAVAVPLYQGVMVWHFDYSFRCDQSIAGRPNWQAPTGVPSFPTGQYLIPLNFMPGGTKPRIGFRDIGANTNKRTLAPALLPPFPHSNKVPVLAPRNGSRIALLACLGSFVADAAIRLKISQATINWFYMEELPLPPSNAPHWTHAFERCVLGLCGRSPWFANEWLEVVPIEMQALYSWQSWWVKSFAENQRRRAVIDAVVAHAYGLSLDDVAWLMKDCFHPTEFYSTRDTRRQLDPKGFWRVDEKLPPPIRHTTLFLSAYRKILELVQSGFTIPAAVDLMVGELPGGGWTIPEEAMLLFQSRGDDNEEIFSQSPEESWRELREHRRNLFETPLWTGALASNPQNTENQDTFE